MAVNILLRRGTAAEWTASNPILLEAEIGLETDTKKLKAGDGLTVWASLPYITLTPAAASSLYATIASPTFTGTVSGVTKSMVGLGSVDNTADASKPISTATQTALDLKAPLASPTFTGTVAGVTATHVGLGNVNNTSDANKPVSTATQTALDLKAPLVSPTFTGSVSFDTGVSLVFEGATADAFETTLAVADPTADRTLTFPNSTGTLATQEHVASELGTHTADTTSVHGIADTADLATKAYADTAASNAVSTSLGTHEADTLAVHGITNTADLATKSYADTAVSTHSSDTTSVHGITDTSALATMTYADTAVSTHTSDTTAVHGITDTSLLVTIAGSQTLTNKTITAPLGLVKSDVGLGNVNNTADASKPVSTAQQTALDLKANIAGPTFTGTVGGITQAMVGLGNVDNTADTAKPVSTAQQTALDLKLASATAASTYAPLASPTFTGTVSGVTKSHVGLGNVDNTTDANKPVSTATQTALDLKAPLASPALTGTPTAPTATAGTSTTQVATTAFVGTAVSNLVAAAPGALDTLNELATALGNDASFSTTITNALALKAPLASPTFTGTVTLPTGTVTSTMIFDGTILDTDINASAAIAQSKISGLSTSLSEKAPLASPTFTGTVTIPSGASISGFAPLASPTFTGTSTVAAITASGLITASASGVAFTDGTQTLEGVPSRTPIIQKTASYTLSALTERDSLIEVASSSATTVTIPLNSAVAFPVGASIDILQTSTGQVTIAGDSGVTVNSTPGLKLRTQWSSATLFKRATNTWVVYGDLTA